MTQFKKSEIYDDSKMRPKMKSACDAIKALGGANRLEVMQLLGCVADVNSYQVIPDGNGNVNPQMRLQLTMSFSEILPQVGHKGRYKLYTTLPHNICDGIKVIDFARAHGIPPASFMDFAKKTTSAGIYDSEVAKMYEDLL